MNTNVIIPSLFKLYNYWSYICTEIKALFNYDWIVSAFLWKKKSSECNVVLYFSTLKRMEKYVQQVIDTD